MNREDRCIGGVWLVTLIKLYRFVISGLPIFVFRSSYLCNTCGKTYKWKESLNLHKRMECGIEPRFSCKICGRRFKHKHHLTKHHKSIHNYVDQWYEQKIGKTCRILHRWDCGASLVNCSLRTKVDNPHEGGKVNLVLLNVYTCVRERDSTGC